MIAVRLFVKHLRRREVVLAEREPATPRIVDEFGLWMRQHRGSADRTLADYRQFAVSFVVSLQDRHWRRLDAKTVRTYVIDQRKRLTTARMLVLVRALRMFVRFLIATGRCPSHLGRAVPSVPRWRLASLPRYLSSHDIDRVIATRRASTLLGARDRAVLLLLARLGLRAGDVRALRSADIDWGAGRIRVVGKLRRPTWLPLPQEVGDAILAYLSRRPQSAIPEVFLCMKAPYRALGATGVGGITARAITDAAIVSPSKGAHIFRHSTATTLIRGGASLGDIGVLLRHASRDSTALYAKVDVASLRRIAQPWPEPAL